MDKAFEGQIHDTTRLLDNMNIDLLNQSLYFLLQVHVLLPKLHLKVLQELEQGLSRYLNISLLVLRECRLIYSLRFLCGFDISVMMVELLVELEMFL